MKYYMALLCLLLPVAGASGYGPGDTEYLPLSREAMSAYMGRITSEINLRLSVQGNDPIERRFPITNNILPIETLMRNKIDEMFNALIAPIDNGKTADFLYWFSVDVPMPSGLMGRLVDMGDNWPGTNFTISFNGTNLVTPYDLLLYSPDPRVARSWSLAKKIPIPYAGKGVETVNYIWRDEVYGTLFTANICPGYNFNYDVLDLDPAYLYNAAWAGRLTAIEVVIWYSVTNGHYDVFDVSTGNRVRSTVVRMEMEIRGGVPIVAIKGISGKTVRVETSTDMRTWVDTGTVITLDSAGKGVFTPPRTQPVLFIRGRLLP